MGGKCPRLISLASGPAVKRGSIPAGGDDRRDDNLCVRQIDSDLTDPLAGAAVPGFA